MGARSAKRTIEKRMMCVLMFEEATTKWGFGESTCGVWHTYTIGVVWAFMLGLELRQLLDISV